MCQVSCHKKNFMARLYSSVDTTRVILVHTWLTTQRCLTGSFDIIWQLQNIITSDGESLHVNGERQLHSACQVSFSRSCGQPLWQSPSSPHQFSLDVAALFALSIVVSCQKPTRSYSSIISSENVRSHGAGCIRARAGVQHVIYVRGHNNSNALQDKYI